MKAIGIVTKTKGNYATVVSERNSSCSACHKCSSKGSCHAELIFGDQKQIVEFSARNLVGASTGDRIELESSTSVTLLCSFLVFVVPFLVTAIFYFYAMSWLEQNKYLPLIMILCFCLSFVGISTISNTFIKKKHSIFIVKILEESKEHFEAE